MGVLVRFAYTRDAAGNPIAIERESGLGLYYYEYDQLQRLAYEGQFVDTAREYENYYEYRCLCQVDLGARGDFALSSISLS